VRASDLITKDAHYVKDAALMHEARIQSQLQSETAATKEPRQVQSGARNTPGQLWTAGNALQAALFAERAL